MKSEEVVTQEILDLTRQLIKIRGNSSFRRQISYDRGKNIKNLSPGKFI